MYMYVARKGYSIYETYYDSNGQKKMRKQSDDMGIELGVKDISDDGVETTKTDIYGNPLQTITFDTLKEYENFIYSNKGYIDIYGNISAVYHYISNKYKGKVDYNLNNIKTFIIDIETATVKYYDKSFKVGTPEKHYDVVFGDLCTFFTEEELKKQQVLVDGEWLPYNERIFIECSTFPNLKEPEYRITAITIKDSKTGIFHVCSEIDYDKYQNTIGIDPDKIQFHKSVGEQDMFNWLIKLVRKEKPDIMIGWNSEQFDFPYIINRSYIAYKGEDTIVKMSPWDDVRIREYESEGRTMWETRVGGIYMMDYMKIYKKFI